ncbi:MULTISPECIES: hypothetical protein [unclassified Streptomyces]|uniref:hypothetical protein n=1 Tax=unclassified Streptomyces TaxID=2593676 RepID=UPI002441623D|nr:hypothetical protein [Streptomyces sp. DH41]MDG9728650.1 hypothetical protein [Streptomyces sp. DH41]
MSDDWRTAAPGGTGAAEPAAGAGSGPPERRGAAPGPRQHRADHVTDDSDAFIDLCASALSEDGLHHVAQYHWGVFNYSADILDRLPVPTEGSPAATDPADRRRQFTRVGRQLHYVLGRMDHVLRSVDSGRLVRSVLQFGDGAVFHYYFRSDEYLTGFSLRADTVDAGDRAMADLIAAFREELGLPFLNPGGFVTASCPSAATPWAGSKEPHLVKEGDWGTPDPPVLARCARAVAVNGLHYAGYFAPDTGHLTADVFNDPALAGFFRTLSRDERRTRYVGLGERLHYVVARLNQSLRAVVPGRLTRVVLDVEEGALFYADRGEGRFALGVSLDESQVARADRRMTDLVHSLAAMTREERDETR